MLTALFQPGHPVRGGRAVAFGGVARVAGQDEIPDLVEVTVLPSSGHEHEREHMIDGHPAGPDVGERGVAVGAASVLIAAQRGPDTGDGSRGAAGRARTGRRRPRPGSSRTTPAGCPAAGPMTSGRGSSGHRPRAAGPVACRPLASSRRWSVSVMPWRPARSSTKKRVWVGSPPRLTWKASMTFAKPSRTVTSASCAASSSPRLRERQASRNWLWADVLCRSSTCRCSQMAAA